MDPYIGEIKLFAGTFAPQGWLACNGSLVSIVDYQVLYVLIGTTYGGDGVSTFALPDLRGRVPVHQTSGMPLGQTQGTEMVTLVGNQLPSHTHPAVATTTMASGGPSGALIARSTESLYVNSSNAVALNAVSVGAAGQSQPHNNMQPSMALNYIIAVEGIYPSQD